MKKVILALVVAGSAMTGAATSASAQGVYFGFGDGGYRHHYYGDEGYRPYYRHRAYAYGEGCFVRTVRHFNRYRGVWVVRRVRTCD
jgi:hypothetical protein